MSRLTTLLHDAEARLTAPIAAYYDGRDAGGPTDPASAGAAFREALTALLDAVAVLAAGTTLSSAVQTRLQALKYEQLLYAAGFIAALPTLTRGQAIARATLYVNSLNRAYSELATLYVPTLPQYPGDGNTVCDWHCRCHLTVTQVGARDYDVRWVLTPEAEHCDDCLRLAATWAPLQIRDGQIVSAKAIAPGVWRRLRAVAAIAGCRLDTCANTRTTASALALEPGDPYADV